MRQLLKIIQLLIWCTFAWVPLIKLKDNESRGRCMDGSPPAYYLDQATVDSSSTKWVLSLEGGGECAEKSQCESRVLTLGTSNFYPPYVKHLPQLVSGDANENPIFNTWNHVRLMYCSQDLWTGQVTDPSTDTFDYYFSGHLIVKDILNHLENNFNFKNATEIILTGESAGGIGVWNNLDYLAARYPSARVVGAPIAGFYFFAYPYTGPDHTSSGLVDFRKQFFPQYYKLWTSFVDQDCAKSLDEPGYCILSNNSYPFISTPVFATEAQSDKVVLTAHDSIPNKYPNFTNPELAYLQEWSNNMTSALKEWKRQKPHSGYFNAACFIHTTFSYSNPTIKGLPYQKYFLDWYRGNGQSAMDDCGILCNPTCPNKE